MKPLDELQGSSITIFTIGYTKKNARNFFELLRKADAIRVVDIRLNNVSQLAGFTKRDDLRFFLKEILGIDYSHQPDMAPTKDILDGYRKKKITWAQYEQKFIELLNTRRVQDLVTPEFMDKACLLCSEPTPDQCHRRLVAEYLKSKWGKVEIHHL